MSAIARAEFIQLMRNQLVLASAVLIPLAFAALLVFSGRAAQGGYGVVAAMLATCLPGFATYLTATTTLAARRQTRFLQRLRCAATGDTAIVGGLLVPAVVITLVQLVAVFAVLAAIDHPPAQVATIAIAVLAILALFVGFAMATAAYTHGPDHAQITTLPLFFLTVGAGAWIAMTGTEEFGDLKRWLPGGAPTELVMVAWAGDLSPDWVALLIPTALWAIVALVVGRLVFRWEPRR